MRLPKALLLALVITTPLFAATYPPSLRWRTISTEHFDIHFHTGEEELARRTATMAEHIHRRITPLMDYEPSSRTDIVLTDHVDVSNGSATPFPSNRIELYVSAPGADPSSPIEYYDDWLNMVLTHEYTHILHLDQANGLWGGLRRVFGRNPLTFPNAYSPLWITEGIATLVESEATDAGRLKGTFVDMILRTAAVENRWASSAQAGGITPAWPGGNARYYYGSKFLSWVAQRYGMEKLAQFFHDYAGNVIPFRPNASAEAVFGRELSDLWEEWSREQQAAYRAEAAALERSGFTQRTKLTDLGFDTMYPTLDPRGERLVYAHRGPYERGTLRLVDLGSGRELATVAVNSESALSWRADGEVVAFSQLERHRTFAILSDIYLWNVKSGDVRQVTHGARLKDPAFAPDGRTLVAVENRAGRNRLVEVDAQSGAVRALVSPSDFTQFSEPSVSADGSMIVVAEWNAGRGDIVLYDRSGRRLRSLTQQMPRATNASPRFTRDGDSIVFSSDVTGVPNIYRVPLSGGTAERISSVYGALFFPATTDGRTIYAADLTSKGFDIVRFDETKSYDVTPRVVPSSVVSTKPGVSDVTAAAIEPSTAPDRPYSPLRSATPRWWFPLLETTLDSNDEVESVGVGAITSGSDALGFHRYDLQFLARSGDNVRNSFDYAAVYQYDRWYPTFTGAAFGYSDEPSIGLRLSNGDRVDYRERTDRQLLLATVPFARLRWQTSFTAGVVRDHIDSDLAADVSSGTLSQAGIFTGTLQGVRASATFNNASTFGYSISPENGLFARIDHESLSPSLGSDASVRQSRADLRGYLTIPYRRSPLGRHVLAARAAAGEVSGDFVLQRDLRVGGTGLGELASVDLREFPVRGFSTGELRGRNAMVASLEYRFPIYEIDRGPSTFPIFFRRILGDVFYDTGTAWDREAVALPAVSRPATSAFDQRLTSVGAEVSVELITGYALPIVYRLGVAQRLEGPEDGPSAYLTLGSSF